MARNRDSTSSGSNFEEYRRDLDERRRGLEAEFCELLDPNSSSGRLIYAFARGRLHQFHLSGDCQEAYLVNEAYKRTIEAHERGEVIKNLRALLKVVIYRICQEESRTRQRFVPLEKAPDAEGAGIASEELECDLTTYGLAFQVVMRDVEPLEREILVLKVIQDFSWKQVRKTLQERGFGDHSEANLRKYKERLLIRLRKKYHAFKPDGF